MVVFILHLVGGGRTEGLDTEAGQFFKAARRSGLWPNAQPAGRSAISQQRNKLHWEAFQETQQRAFQVASDLWPESPDSTWHGFSVYAIDGSKFTLPGTSELRQTYDPKSGFENPGKGHYPQCLVSTLYDVFRRLPVDRTLAPIDASEREEAIRLLPSIPPGGLLLLDRGYPSYEMFHHLLFDFEGHFLVRSPATQTFSVIAEFVKSGKAEAILDLTPPGQANASASDPMAETPSILPLRAIRIVDSEGKESVLITDLLDKQAYPRQELIDLYYQRYRIEEYYRDEKIVYDVERFHGHTQNSICQELYAAMIMTVISRTMAALAETVHDLDTQTVQSKNAVIALANDAALLVPENPELALTLFGELLDEMARVKYYRPKTPRPHPPRVSKGSVNKWKVNRQKTLGILK